MTRKNLKDALALARQLLVQQPEHEQPDAVDEDEAQVQRYLQRRSLLEPVEEEVVGDEEGVATVAPQTAEELSDAAGDELEQAATIAQANPQVDDLQRKKLLRDGKWKALRDEAPWVRATVPPSVLRGTLGGQQEVISDLLLPRTQQVAFWPGDDAEATIVTVTAGPVQLPTFDPTAAGPFPSLRPFGRILWGVRGMSLEAEFDLGRGCQFSIEAASVYLQVGLEPSVGAIGSLKMAGMLGFLPCEKSCMMTRSKYIDAAGGGSTTRVTVPAFAKQVWFNRTPATEPITLNFVDSTGATVYSVSLLANQFMADPVPLSSDIIEIQVVDGAMAGFTGRLIFGLSF